MGESREERLTRTIDVLARIALGAARGDADPPSSVMWIERGIAGDVRAWLDAFRLLVPRPTDSVRGLARRMVETDDDVPVDELSAASEDERRSPRWAAKARLFLQFLFERDAAKARAFIGRTKTGQPEAAEALDAEYRRWVVETF